jgi:hypothetical protein
MIDPAILDRPEFMQYEFDFMQEVDYECMMRDPFWVAYFNGEI